MSDSKALYEDLWNNYIQPSCMLIDDGKYVEAKNTYINMVKYLCERFSVPVDDRIMKKYNIKV